jgi:hypothetical protein
MKLLKTVLISSALLLGNTAFAEVTQDCIFTGEVRNNASSGDVRVKFKDVKRGEKAPCRLARGNSRARVEFKAKPEDQLENLPTGTAVQYRYQRRNGKDQWDLVNTGVSDT